VSARRPLILLAIALTALLGAGVAWRARGTSDRGVAEVLTSVEVASGRTRVPNPWPEPRPSPSQSSISPTLATASTMSETTPSPPAPTHPEPSPSQPGASLEVRFVDASGAPAQVYDPKVTVVGEGGAFLHQPFPDLRTRVAVPLDAALTGRVRVSAIGAGTPEGRDRDPPLGIAWATDVVAVEVAPGAREPVDLPLVPPAPLTVRVRDTLGRPVDGAAVKLTSFETSTHERSDARTDAQGIARFAASRSLTGPGQVVASAEWLEETAGRRVILGAAPTTVDLVLPAAPPAGRLVLRLMDLGRPGAYYEGSVGIRPARRSPFVPTAFVEAVRGRSRVKSPPVDGLRQESFTLPAGPYVASFHVGDGFWLTGPFEVASGATTTADVAVPPPGTLRVRTAARGPDAKGPPGEVHVTVTYLDYDFERGRVCPPGSEAAFEGLGPISVRAVYVDADASAALVTRCALVSGETIVIEAAPVPWGAISARVVDVSGAAIEAPLEATWSRGGDFYEQAHVRTRIGAPPVAPRSYEPIEGAAGAPGRILLRRVPPGPSRLEVEGIAVDVLVRAGETAEPTIVLPVTREALARQAPEDIARAATVDAALAAGVAPPLPGEAHPEESLLEALVVDEAGRPITDADVLFRVEGEGGGWLTLDYAGPGRAGDMEPVGEYLLRARAPDRLDGPVVRAVVKAGEETRVRLEAGPREGAATLLVRGRAPGSPGRPWVAVADAEAGPMAVAPERAGREGAFLERREELDHAGVAEVSGLPSGRTLRVDLVPDRDALDRPPAGRRARARPGSFAIVTLAPGERREVDLALPEAALVTAGPIAALGRLTALDAATLAPFEGASRTPEGQTLSLADGTYAIGLERDTPGASVIEGIRVVTLGPGERLAWNASPSAPGGVTVRGLYRTAPEVPPEARRALLAGPALAISLSDGRLFAHDRLPAGRYTLRVGGREVRAWDAAPGQVLELGVVEGR